MGARRRGRCACDRAVPSPSGAGARQPGPATGAAMKRYDANARHGVTLTLNGLSRTGQAEPRTLLSVFLRETLGATGTHVGCEHGVCGACTVRLDGSAVRSCLTLAVQVEGRHVDTLSLIHIS